MSTPVASTPVVVGIDGAGSAWDALDWAAAEAAARGCPLRIVHAFHPPVPADPYGVIPPMDLLTAHEAAQALLRHAATRAHRVVSDLPMSTQLVPGTAAHALLTDTPDAGLLVLGGRDRRGLRALLTRSLSARVAAHACCPVAVVRTQPGAGAPACSAPRVVVGVDGSAASAFALAHGLRAARRRGVPLVALHAWTPDPPADIEGFSAIPDQAEGTARRLLEDTVRPWTTASPDVAIISRLVCDEPGHALVTESRGAALLVVGAPQRGRLRHLLSGSTSRRALRHSHCPTTVVHHQVSDPTAGTAATLLDAVPDADSGPGEEEERVLRRRGRSKNRRRPT